MSLGAELAEVLGEDAVLNDVAGGELGTKELPNAVGVGDAESSTAGIEKIIQENVGGSVGEADNVIENANQDVAEQKTKSAGSSISDGDFVDWDQAANDVINTLP